MNAGAFDEYVSIQGYTTSVDSNTGEKLLTWSELFTAWARIDESPAGIEQVNADRREHKQTVTFYMRYNSALNVTHRIQWSGRYYNVVNIRDEVRRLYMTVQTELSE